MKKKRDRRTGYAVELFLNLCGCLSFGQRRRREKEERNEASLSSSRYQSAAINPMDPKLSVWKTFPQHKSRVLSAPFRSVSSHLLPVYTLKDSPSSVIKMLREEKTLLLLLLLLICLIYNARTSRYDGHLQAGRELLCGLPAAVAPPGAGAFSSSSSSFWS